MPTASNIWDMEAEYVRGAETWRNTISVARVGTLDDVPPGPTHAIVLAFTNFMQAQGFEGTFLENVTLRPVIYNEAPGGSEHPPVWQNNPHLVTDGEANY